MKATSSVASSGIVHGLLTKDSNYERWRVVMQNYLQGQGLWDVVQSANSEDEMDHHASKKMKDAKAFHIFPPSRGRDILESTKISWNHLITQTETELKAAPDIEQGLWGVVQSVCEEETETPWKMKDAKALHIIQLSCGKEILDEISRFETAKRAWNYLSEQYSKEFKAAQQTEQGTLNNSLGQHKELFRKVSRGDYIGDTGMVSDIYLTSASGRTLLHAAVIAGNVNNVDKLVKVGRDKLLRMQDNNGYTALALAARYTRNAYIAKCMVERKDRTIRDGLLTIQSKDEEIPVLLAASEGNKEMTTYLYSKTPLDVFDGHPRNRLLLFARCIAAEIFGVALKLLKHYPDVSTESLLADFSTGNVTRERVEGKFSVLDALAKMPSAFPSGSRFGLRQRLIYDSLSVEREIRDHNGISSIENFVTRVANTSTRRPKTPSSPSVNPSARGFLKKVLKFLLVVKRLGGLCCRLVMIFLFLPVMVLGFLPLKLFGLLLRRIACWLVQLFNCLNIFGIREIYEQKCTHYEALGILSYFSQSIADFNDSQLKKASAYDAMLHAAQYGIIEFINAMNEVNHDLLSAVDSFDRDIFSCAILNRKQNVFQLISCLNGAQKEMFTYGTDTFGNNLLHMAAQLGSSSDPDSKSGAALQMQREIQWFKAVEEVVHPLCKEAKNNDGKKPHELFTEFHRELIKVGEEWAKATASSYTIVGTLITTMMFAAAFTVPGGYHQETGLPIFSHDKIFTTFLIADAISLFTSATSVIIFIGILTSRYAEKDFLTSLPWKVLFGLVPLILSVCSMIVAFCAALAIIFKGYQSYSWFIVGPTLSIASVPIIVLVVSQLPLMYDIFHSTRKNPIIDA